MDLQQAELPALAEMLHPAIIDIVTQRATTVRDGSRFLETTKFFGLEKLGIGSGGVEFFCFWARKRIF